MSKIVVTRTIPWMDNFFASPAQVRFLRLLARDPSKYWTGREAAGELGMAPSTANVVLRRLRSQNLLDIRQVGPSQLFRLRTDLPMIDHVVEFFHREEETLGHLTQALSKVVPQDASCTLFGSSVRGERKQTSDVDVLIVAGNKTEAQRIAGQVRDVLRSHLPFSVDVLALSRQEAKDRNHHSLVREVREEGRHLAGIPIGGLVE